MDPLTLGLAAASAGAGMFGTFVGHNEKKQQVRDANRQIKAQNRFSMQNWQYNEQMRQRQNRNARAIYEMRKQEFSLQKELDYDAYKEFYEDSQLQFNNLVRDVKAKSFQSAMKLVAFQNQSTASALNRGAVGRRAGVRAANAEIMRGIEQRSRADKLVFAEQQMDKNIGRQARRTNLRIQQAFNRIGPAPEDLPVAPMPVMGQMQRSPSDIGLYSGLLSAGLTGFTTMNSLTAPSTGTPSGGTSFNNTYNTNFQYGGSKQAYGSGLDLGSMM
jgi:hypothetical protein